MHNSTKISLIFPRVALITLSCWLGSVTACEQIIGLEERKLGDDTPALCQSYCKDVLKNCKAPLDAYKSESDCLAVCSFLPAGARSATQMSVNTVSCRARLAKQAASVESEEMTCPAAGPGGGSEGAATNCGDICETYCGLRDKVCGDKKQADCLDRCGALPDSQTYSADADFKGGDTIQCRLSHLTAAAVAKTKGDESERKIHCDHSLLRAGLGERPFCDLPAASEPDCNDYCNLVDQACIDHPVYSSKEQCLAVCEKGVIPKGTNTNPDNTQDSHGDTIACRRWHAYFAYDTDPETHCPHAGPTGDGHCGTSVCSTYCATLQRGCKNVYEREFPGANGKAMCEAACRGLRGVKSPDVDMGYDVSKEEFRTDTLACRFGYLVDAMSGMSVCDKALPKGMCQR